MNESDLKLCKELLAVLSSAKYSAKNYLFLEPVDLNIFTTYASIVPRPMDLSTVTRNLENDVYSTKEECLNDCNLCFDNAETFHKNFPENKWIIKLGKEMKKIVSKEHSRLEKQFHHHHQQQQQQPKQNSGGNTLAFMRKTPKANKSLISNVTSFVASSTNISTSKSSAGAIGENMIVTTATEGEKPVKAKLSLKLSAGKSTTSTTVVSVPVVKLETTKKNKLNLKIATNSIPSEHNALSIKTSSATQDLQVEVSSSTTKSKKKEQQKQRVSLTTSSNKSSSNTLKSALMKAMSKPVPSSASTMSIDTSHVSDGGMMTDIRKDQCYKTVSALKRSDYENIAWFTQPISDPRLVDDYKSKIPNPMDIGTVISKLDKDEYPTVTDFALDMRRVFSNCLVFNNTAHDSFREVAVKMISLLESLMHFFLQSPQNSAGGGLLYTNILYCWKECVAIIDSAMQLKNPDDGFPTIHYFLFPVSFYFGGVVPPEYAEQIKKPMDFGTITLRLIEGHYRLAEEFVSDCKLVTSNCVAFYSGRSDGSIFVEQASRLEDFLLPHLDLLLRYDASPQGDYAKKIALNPVPIKLKTVPQSIMLNTLEALRNLNYVDKHTKYMEPAAAPFELPVNIEYFSDYLDYVKRPMDLSTVEQNVRDGKYELPEDFENDVNLIFRNCEAYNIPKKNSHILNVSRTCAKFFKKAFSQRMRSFLSSESNMPIEAVESKMPISEASSSAQAVAPIKKKIKSSEVTRTSEVSIPLAKPKPRIILALGPLPLHVAIAKVKQDYENRRMHKDLVNWEGACSKFYRDLKKHPWIASSKRFVFDAPVTLLHPEIKAAYFSKIKKPMDLTTAECRLLHGGYYSSPQHFVDDIALVFMNAVIFNQGGYEEGDPTSCAYYDASRHLLRYTRWLSLDSLSEYLVDDSALEGVKVQGPIPQWKLSVSNHRDALEEMEEIVMNHFFDKSEDGESYTWIENECEKLLRSLRTQSDAKYMRFFIEPIYPENYYLYISKPISWLDCDKKLQDRKYEIFGDLITDLRLIFENAKKYNGKMKDTDPISRLAYDSATIMAEKLEISIQKLFVAASDRLEREKVENDVLDREERLAEKLEEERITRELQLRRERQLSVDVEQTQLHHPDVIARRTNKRKIDFDMPFYEEEAPREQFEVDILKQQKLLYEKQQQSRKKMHEVTRHIGMRVFHKLSERYRAIEWRRINGKLTDSHDKSSVHGDSTGIVCNALKPSSVASLLDTENRDKIKVKLSRHSHQKQKKKRMRLSMDF